jgi:YD repeat-containing protein
LALSDRVATVSVTETDGGTTVYTTDRSRPDQTTTTVQLPDQTQNQMQQNADGTAVTSLGNGSVTWTTQLPDPIHGLLAPTSSSATQLPSGLTRTASTQASTVLSDPFDLDSWTSRTTTTDINGQVWTQVYDRASRTRTLTTPEQRVWSVVFDEFGRPVLMRAAGGHSAR